MSADDKRREARLRRVAARQGMQLMKCRSRDPRAVGYGTYQLVDTMNNTVRCFGLLAGFGMTLDDVAESLGEAE